MQAESKILASTITTHPAAPKLEATLLVAG
jgi:hypothetical protein